MYALVHVLAWYTLQIGSCAWTSKPSKKFKAKYGTRSLSESEFCDFPVFGKADTPQNIGSHTVLRLKPFMIRSGSTLMKEAFKKENLLKNAKENGVVSKFGNSWTIVRNGGTGHEEIPLDKFIRDHMHKKQYDGSTQMERPYVFHPFSGVLALEGSQFGVPPLIQSSQAKSNLTFDKRSVTPGLLVGAALSGIGFHRHSATFQMMAHGYKRWMFYPPERSPPGGDDGSWPIYDWMDNVYPLLEGDAKPMECIQGPGDVMWIPEHWYHATLNLGDTVAVSLQHDEGESEAYILQRKWSSLELIDPQGIVYAGNIIKLQPDNMQAQADMALAFALKGRIIEAENLTREVLKRDPFHMSAMVILDEILQAKVDVKRTGAKEELRSTLKTLAPTLEKNPRSFAANRLLSKYCEMTNDQAGHEKYEGRLDFLEEMGIEEPNIFNVTDDADNTKTQTEL